MNRFTYILTLITLLATSCSQKNSKDTMISGCIHGAARQLLMLQEVDLDRSTGIDSVVLSNEGKFLFRLSSDSAGIYLLRLKEHAPAVLEILPGDSVHISSDFSSFPADITISGSQTSRDLQDFLIRSARNKAVFDSLEYILIAQQDDPDFAEMTVKLDEMAKPVFERQRSMEKEYIDRHLNSLTSLLVLNHGISVSPVLHYEEDSIYFLKLDSSLSKAFPGNKHVVFHHKRIIQSREMMRTSGRSE